MTFSILSRRYAFAAFVAWLVFIVYGSLVPFEIRDVTLEQGIKTFQAIGFLDLGVVSRADWIANILLYVPLSFLGCVWLLGLRRVSAAGYLALIFVFGFGVAVAVAVEFVQVFFAPRTVSLNDLLAETIGTLIGILLWTSGRRRIAQLADGFAEGGRQSVLAAVVVYGLVYFAFSLFPLDFVVSASELAWKLETGQQGWLIAGDCADWIRCTARLLGDVLAIAPLGTLIALAIPRLSLRSVFLAGMAIGVGLEGLQLFLASGTSQGLSVVLRACGLAGGWAIGRLLGREGPAPLAAIIWRAAPFLALPYLSLIAGVNGWFSRAWLPLGEALARLPDLRLMPFYYHYFSTEPAAMASLLANAAMYGPIGLVVWARSCNRGRDGTYGWGVSAFLAVLVAIPIELGKLFVPPKHPDFTDVLIAAVAAAFVCALAGWIGRVLLGAEPGETLRRPPSTPAVAPRQKAVFAWPAPRPVGVLAGIPALAGAVLGLVSYPVGAAVWLVILVGYGVLLWRLPLLWLFVIPAALAAVDLSPVTGTLLLDELDLLVLVTLAVGYARYFSVQPTAWPHPLLRLAVILLWVTWILSTARGFWPLIAADGSVSVGSHSVMDTWMVGKGLLWALLLVPLLRRVPAEELESARGYVINGVVAGLVVVVLVVLRERHVFVGLGDFENVFRVTGTFASMNTGGAYIEAFLAFSFPILVAWVLMQPSWLMKLTGAGIAALTSYAMLVTFSRGGYVALVAGLLVVTLGALRLRTGARKRRWTALTALTLIVIGVAYPVFTGGFAQYRLARAVEDLTVRQAHWGQALSIMDDGVLPGLTGMGFGQYPTLYLLRGDYEKPPGTFGVVGEDGNSYLRLGAGEPVFLDQIVSLEPDTSYRLSARIRQSFGDAPLKVSLCEKALLYSFQCVWAELRPRTPEAGWSQVSVEVSSGKLGGGERWPHPPVKLSLHNPGGSAIDVDDVQLSAGNGEGLVANGGFDDGTRRWLFVTDQDIAWHIHQQWVETYFAQGWPGVLAVVVLLLGVAALLLPALLRGDLWATALAGALVAFLTVGLLGSTLDTARLSLLFYLGSLFAGFLVDRLGEASASRGAAFSKP